MNLFYIFISLVLIYSFDDGERDQLHFGLPLQKGEFGLQCVTYTRAAITRDPVQLVVQDLVEGLEFRDSLHHCRHPLVIAAPGEEVPF